MNRTVETPQLRQAVRRGGGDGRREPRAARRRRSDRTALRPHHARRRRRHPGHRAGARGRAHLRLPLPLRDHSLLPARPGPSGPRRGRTLHRGRRALRLARWGRRGPLRGRVRRDLRPPDEPPRQGRELHQLPPRQGALPRFRRPDARGPRVIFCCSEKSVYDPAGGARVLGGPARQPLATILLQSDPESGALSALGTVGGEMYDAFFEKFAFRLALEHETAISSAGSVRPRWSWTSGSTRARSCSADDPRRQAADGERVCSMRTTRR